MISTRCYDIRPCCRLFTLMYFHILLYSYCQYSNIVIYFQAINTLFMYITSNMIVLINTIASSSMSQKCLLTHK